jgi:hypothetical protein
MPDVRFRSCAAALLTVLVGCSGAARPVTWAQPVTLAGVQNLHRVSDDLYRGAQPDRAGFEALDMDLVEIPIEPDDFGDTEVAAFLSVVSEPDRTPVFVHCKFGADRTGAMVGAYRIVIQGWSREQAVEELRSGGFGYHRFWKLPLSYLETFDPKHVAELAGIAP